MVCGFSQLRKMCTITVDRGDHPRKHQRRGGAKVGIVVRGPKGTR